MGLDETRFPALIRQLYSTVAELQAMFPGRPFTPDGHLVGSLAECFAEYYYGLRLAACSTTGHDAYLNGRKVEIKATQGSRVSLRSGPELLLVFLLLRDGSLEEIYSGPGAPVWSLVESKPRPSNGQYSVSLAQLRKLMKDVPPEQRVPLLRPLPTVLQR
jgi:hypothetical protein